MVRERVGMLASRFEMSNTYLFDKNVFTTALALRLLLCQDYVVVLTHKRRHMIFNGKQGRSDHHQRSPLLDLLLCWSAQPGSCLQNMYFLIIGGFADEHG
jgi:hypothetical protein